MQIHTYAKQGNIKGVAKEIAKGVDIDRVDKDNSQTPLMCAVTSTNAGIDMVEFLVENGANVNAGEKNEFQKNCIGISRKFGKFG